MIHTNYFTIDKWDFKSESILQGLPLEDVELMMANCTVQHYAKGEIIFREGCIPSGIFYIRDGKVKIYTVDSNGRERIIYVAKTGELLGYHAILSGDRYSDSAAPLEKSMIAFIPKEDFFYTLDQSKELSKRLLKTLSHEFTVLINALSLFGQKPVRERLALHLTVLHEKYNSNGNTNETNSINISRTDLANLVGTARENVVRHLSEFKHDGIVSINGRNIKVNHLEQLVNIANIR